MAMESAVSVLRRELSNLRKQVDSLRHMMRSEVTKMKQLLLLQRQTSGSGPPGTSTDCTSGGTQTGAQLQRGGGPERSDKILSTLSGMAIGRVRSCFKEKNGTPRQPGLCSKATGSLTVEAFNNPRHSLEGLEEYSHIWLLFVFHKNVQDFAKAKVRPPCLDGRKVGVFASRSPHRPCPIGLTLAKLESIEGDTLHLSGIDLIDGTPILDVKPYIPRYDSLHAHPDTGDRGQRSSPLWEASTGALEAEFTDGRIQSETGDSTSLYPEVKVASWLEQRPVSLLEVEFLPQAEEQLKQFKCKKPAPPTQSETTIGEECQREYAKNDESRISDSGCISESLDSSSVECFPKFEEEENSSHSATDTTTMDANGSESAYFIDSFTSIEDAREAIIEMLQQDTRSVYRRTKCPDQAYKVSIDNLNLTCQFRHGRIIVMTVEPKVLWEREKLIK